MGFSIRKESTEHAEKGKKGWISVVIFVTVC